MEASVWKRRLVVRENRPRGLFVKIIATGAFAALAASMIAISVAAQSTPAYVALGDSIEFGLGDDITIDGYGYVPPFGDFLSSVLVQPVSVLNLGVPFARTTDILRTQLPAALAALAGHQPAIVSWGGGGNDLAVVATGPEAAACRRNESCLGRFNGLLNEVEQTIDQTIARIRGAIGPNGRILMRTQYNSLLRTGCASPDVATLASITLEGAPGTVLDRGLNDRIRSVADKYGANVVDLFLPFAFAPDSLVASDCVHPSGVGYQAILGITEAAYLAGP
jgi:lysophospholipase L1-like esterase